MRVLVTGGAGFQGSHLVGALLSRGYEVTILNTLSEQAEKNLARIIGNSDKVKIVWGSVTDKEIVEKTVREQDVCFHLAAQIHVDESIQAPAKSLNVNIKGTFNVLESCKVHGVKLIFASTCEVYGNNLNGLTTEEHPMNPRSPYAASKAGAERLAYAYHCSYGLPLVIMRPFNVYGAGQKSGIRGAVIPRFIERAMKGEPIEIYGNGEQARDFIYVKDVIAGYMLALDNFEKLNGKAMNLGTGEATSIKEIARLITHFTGNKSEVHFIDPRPGEVSSFAADTGLAKSIGFAPRFDIAAGLSEYVDSVKRNGF